MTMFGSRPLGISDQPDWLKMLGQSQTVPQPQMPASAPQAPTAGGMMGQHKTPGFGEPGGWGERLGAIGSVLLNTAGVQDDGYNQYMQMKQQRRQAAQRLYQPQDVGGALVQLNPRTGKYEAVYTPPTKDKAPHYWETNDGSLAAVGGDYSSPTVLYKDPTPKVQWYETTDAQTGAKTLTPVWPGMQSGGADLPPGYKVRPKGGSGSGPSGFQPSVSSLWPALNKQESGGNYAAVGPQTQYGQALGGNQLMMGTAKDMATKLGLPFRPDLLTATTPDAKQYQDALGQAYLQQGFDATGNARDALRYYHGGPNRKLWGRKTNAYADSILSRAGIN